MFDPVAFEELSNWNNAADIGIVQALHGDKSFFYLDYSALQLIFLALDSLLDREALLGQELLWLDELPCIVQLPHPYTDALQGCCFHEFSVCVL